MKAAFIEKWTDGDMINMFPVEMTSELDKMFLDLIRFTVEHVYSEKPGGINHYETILKDWEEQCKKL